MAPLSARGQRLAHRYELERELSADRQAQEWLARDAALDRKVVLRLLRPELAGDATETERFWEAARAAARTSKVGEPRILDGGTDTATGELFVVREWREDEPGRESIDEPVPERLERLEPSRGVRRGVTPGVTVDGAGHVAARVLGLVLALAVAAALVGVGAGAWLAWVNEPLGRPAQSLNLAPAVGAPAGQATSVPRTPSPTLAPTAGQHDAEAPTPLPAAADGPALGTPATGTPETGTPADGEPRRVVNTDGLGVALRASPGGDRQPGQGYAEGALVMVIEQQGAWARIRGGDGREGWVLAVTLAPTTIAPTRPGAAAQAPVNPPVAPASGRERVVNTDGLGVALRAAPDGDRFAGKGYDEGTTLTVLERSGTWTHVRGDDGRDGWVPSVTLTPS